jgi:hypothetical protein
MRKNLSICVLALLILNGCKRPQTEESSISIQIPTAQQFSERYGKVQSLSTTVDFSLLCFAVNVKGEGITTKPALTCDVERGVVSSTSVAPGETLTISVDPGKNRVFEIYGFLRDSNSTACPSMVDKLNWPIKKVYWLGSKEVETLDAGDVQLNIDLTLPAVSHNLAVEKGWPASCGGAPSKPTAGVGVVGAAVLSNSGISLKAHVAEKQTNIKLSQGGITFQGRVHEQ